MSTASVGGVVLYVVRRSTARTLSLRMSTRYETAMEGARDDGARYWTAPGARTRTCIHIQRCARTIGTCGRALV